MIIPMKKVDLVIPAADHLKAVDALRDLGILHVESAELAEDAARSGLESALAELSRQDAVLQGLSAKGIAPADAALQGLSGQALVDKTRELLNEQARVARRTEQLETMYAELLPWGNFEPETVKKLETQGVHLYCCMASEKELAALQAQGRCCEILGRAERKVRFVVVSQAAVPADELPLVKLPELSLLAIEKELAELARSRKQVLSELLAVKTQLAELRAYSAELAESLEYLTVRDTLTLHYGKLLTLSGFVPAPELPRLVEAAKANGWGVVERDADAGREAVPTLLKVPKWAKIIDPLMSFIAISPGYNELDVSIPVLLFFSVFFGMLVGDAGYGLLFLGATVGLYFKMRNRVKPEQKRLFGLLGVLSSAAILWGALTGNYFGIECKGLPWLTTAPNKDGNVQLVCFSLALLQLSLGRALQFLAGSGWKHKIGQFGWILVLIGNFILVYNLLLAPGGNFPAAMLWLYGVGIACCAAGEIDWSDVGSIFGFPFSVVGSFVDMLSYIRLFAVGMAGFYLAKCFNDMAAPMMQQALTIPVGIVVLLFGHLLNITLAAMGVLVHGVRLNTLEFSNHLGLRWSGFLFQPFRRREVLEEAQK